MKKQLATIFRGRFWPETRSKKAEMKIVVDTPFLTLEAYAQRTGESLSSVQSQADAGKLVIYKRTEEGKRGKRYVNMVAEFKRADDQEY